MSHGAVSVGDLGWCIEYWIGEIEDLDNNETEDYPSIYLKSESQTGSDDENGIRVIAWSGDRMHYEPTHYSIGFFVMGFGAGSNTFDQVRFDVKPHWKSCLVDYCRKNKLPIQRPKWRLILW